MELKEFIKKSLVEIRTGIYEANEELIVNLDKEYRPFSIGDMRNKIDFDVAITVENNESAKVEGGPKVAIAKLGSDVESSVKTNNLSRIKFSVYTNYNLIS